MKADKVVPCVDAAHFKNCLDVGILEDIQFSLETLVQKDPEHDGLL